MNAVSAPGGHMERRGPMIRAIRFVASSVMMIIVAIALWKTMNLLSWKVDGSIALIAAVLWAYAFERHSA